MSPGEYASLSAQLQVLQTDLGALHEDVLEVKELAKETNGRVRSLEIWRSTIDTLRRAREASGNMWATAFMTMVGAISGGLIAVLLRHI